MLKKLLITLGVLFVIVVIAARIIPSFVSEDRIKAVVIEKTKEMLGFDLAINGDLNFYIFPVAGVYIEDVIINKPSEEKGGSPLATLKSVKVDVETLALINGDVIIRSMILDTPNIQLVVNKSGIQNWTGSKKETKQSIYNATQSNSNSATTPSKSIRKLSLEDVRVKNGSVSYTDEQTKENWSAKNIHINISLDDMDSPFEVDGRLEYNNQQLNFDTTFSTLDSFINKKQADIKAKIKSKLLMVEAEGKIDGKIYIGTTSLISPSLTKAIEWLSKKPLQTKFASALPLNISSKTNCSPDMCHFSKSLLKLDTMSMSGDVKAFFNKKIPTVELNVDTNELDFNLFMNEQEQAGLSIISSAQAAEGWSNEPIDFSVLREIDLVARIKAAGIKIKNIHIGQTVFRAKISRGRLTTDIIDADFYGGKATIISSIDTNAKTPLLKKQIDFKDVDIEAFLKDAEISDRLTGKANFKTILISTGHSEQEFISKMNGSGEVKLRDGKIKGINVAQMLRNVQSAFKADMDTSEQSTDFSEMGGTFTIKDGILTNNDLLMKAPLFRAKGKGVVSLPQKNLKYRITPEIVKTAQGQGGKDKTGFSVPIIISGSFDNLKYAPDAKSVIQQIAKDPKKIKKTLKNIKNELKNNKGALKNLLKSF